MGQSGGARGAESDDAEIRHLKTLYRGEFREAFQHALASLSVRDRNMLRQHYVDGLAMEQLGAMYQVHRITIVRRMKEESDVPIRSHGSLSLNHALMAAGLVDRIQITVFPVIAAQTGDEPVFAGAGDFDLDLLEARTLDGRTQELVYRPTRHPWP